MSRQTGTSRQFDDCAQIDMTQHVVINQNPAQWNITAQNLIANFDRYILKVESDNAELNDVIGSAFQQQNLPTVHIVDQFLIQYSDVDAGSVIGFHRHRHVMLVDEHLLVWFWSLRRRNVLGPGNQWLAFRKQIEQSFKFGKWIHGKTVSEEGFGSYLPGGS